VPVLSVPGNIVHNNSNNMYTFMCMYRERKRRETAGENQSHNHLDGVSESTNKRQEKTLKVMRFID